MSKLTELWIKATKETEIEEYSKEVRDLYNYTIQLEKAIDEVFNELKIECIKNVHKKSKHPYCSFLTSLIEIIERCKGGSNE